MLALDRIADSNSEGFKETRGTVVSLSFENETP
jgi:hypothetical protein